jgi:hypothetical protein
MKKIDFAKLKSNYSTSPTSIHKCTMHFPNTCAIRMSEALIKTDNSLMDVFKVAGINKCLHSYVRGAQDLASVLAKPSALGPRTKGWNGNFDGVAPSSIKGKKGIVCYMKIPGYSGQGHIDLWDNTGPVGDDYWDAETIWFWELR